MIEADSHYKNWGKLITADNIHDIDPTYGFTGNLHDTDPSHLLRPFSFSVRSGKARATTYLRVNVLDVEGEYQYISAHSMPGVSQLNSEYTPG